MGRAGGQCRGCLVYDCPVMADSKPAVLDAAAPHPAEAPERLRPHVKLIGLLALGHFVIDANQGSLPAILPFLKAAHGLSYAQAGAIVLVGNLTSSIIQPAFGYLADRSARRWLLPLSLCFAGTGLGFLGLAPSYPALMALILVMGMGIASYHPEGYRTATSVAGERKATALSWFSLGGNAGIAVGPPAMTLLVTTFGLGGSLGMIVPSLLMAVLLVGALPGLSRSAARVAARGAVPGQNRPRAMALLIAIVIVRSWSATGFTTFVPFYYVDYLQADPRLVGPLLFVFLGSGALGTVIAGPLADRFGARPFMTWVLVAATPVGVLFMLTSGGPLAFVALGMFGAILVSTFTITVVLGQAYMPRQPGMASGLIVGFAVGAGGLGVALLGGVADHWGLPAALWISASLPLIGFGMGLFLPTPRDRAGAVARA
jgi:FSR family fosmidomycin resistance protein-like MFS transporter